MCGNVRCFCLLVYIYFSWLAGKLSYSTRASSCHHTMPRKSCIFIFPHISILFILCCIDALLHYYALLISRHGSLAFLLDCHIYDYICGYPMISQCLDCLVCSSHCAPLWVAALGGWLPSVGLQFAFALLISPGSVCRVLSLCLSRSLSALVLHISLENLTLESFRHLYTFLFCIDIIHLVL